MHGIHLQQYILNSEAEHNVLPLNSSCHNGCIFCSHKNTLKNSYLYNFYNYRRELDEVLEHISFLKPGKKVFIGESATKIFEGEPFLFKGINRVLTAVRKHIKSGVISITTSGGYIGSDFFDIIGDIAPLEINYSMNALDPKTRDAIVTDKKSAEAVNNLIKLLNYHDKLKINVSLMAVNEKYTPAAGIYDDVAKLRALGHISLIKVFLPGYSEKLFNAFYKTRNEYHDYITDLKKTFDGINDNSGGIYETPVILEPLAPEHDNRVCGVVPGSRAAGLEMMAGDRILSINATEPISRSHCHELLTTAGNRAEIIFERTENGAKQKRTAAFEGFNPAFEGAGGLVFKGDISYGEYSRLKEIADDLRSENASACLITTGLSLEFMAGFLKRTGLKNISPWPVKNIHFGGNIDCCGLLTLGDVAASLESRHMKEFVEKNNIERVILPSAMFDHLEIDLTGNHLLDFAGDCGYKIYLI